MRANLVNVNITAAIRLKANGYLEEEKNMTKLKFS